LILLRLDEFKCVEKNPAMLSYRITKYNPALRNSDGSYLDDSEWTSISDIGKEKYNKPTFQEYEYVENAYVKTVQLILNKNDIRSLEIDSLEQYNTGQDFINYKKSGELNYMSVEFESDIKLLKDSTEIDSTCIEKYVRLILREVIWMKLISEDFELSFGYDYYMYIKCPDLTPEMIIAIEQLGLFVEPGIEPTTFEFILEE
tara:strand:+ start:315 stop:920 length:606 start_codon:yes stop_codon:yes gene_type:complete